MTVGSGDTRDKAYTSLREDGPTFNSSRDQ
jgi:hypothetical protein